MSDKWTLTAEAKTAPANYSADIKTREALSEALERGLDEVFKREFQEPYMGQNLVRTKKVKRLDGKVATYRGWSGTVPENRDADDIPFATKGEGFSWEWEVSNFRRGIKIERTDIETDEIGATKDGQRDLLDSFKRTVEFQIADLWNRAFGTSGSRLIADDGMYLIDSDRPNPNPEGGTWSNLEDASDLTEDALFQAQLNARKQVGEDGYLYPQKIKKMIIGPDWEKSMWKLLTSDRVLGSNYNDPNWGSAKFSMEDVLVYDYLTVSAIFYLLADPKSNDNELMMLRRVDPTVKTEWGAMPNPDVLYQRLRASFGFGLGSPRKFVRGGLLSAGS